jgi:hypothetical protein
MLSLNYKAIDKAKKLILVEGIGKQPWVKSSKIEHLLVPCN